MFAISDAPLPWGAFLCPCPVGNVYYKCKLHFPRKGGSPDMESHRHQDVIYICKLQNSQGDLPRRVAMGKHQADLVSRVDLP